jgi:hypothetical protein
MVCCHCGEVEALIFQRILHKVESSGDSQVSLCVVIVVKLRH